MILWLKHLERCRALARIKFTTFDIRTQRFFSVKQTVLDAAVIMTSRVWVQTRDDGAIQSG